MYCSLCERNLSESDLLTLLDHMQSSEVKIAQVATGALDNEAKERMKKAYTKARCCLTFTEYW